MLIVTIILGYLALAVLVALVTCPWIATSRDQQSDPLEIDDADDESHEHGRIDRWA